MTGDITIDGVAYDTKDLSQGARDVLASLQFVNEQILQKNNELQIADTARMAYAAALKRELPAT
jgi:hypothetical protein